MVATDACASDPTTSGAGNSVVGGPQPYWESWDFTTAGARAHQVQHAVTGPASGDKSTTYTYNPTTQPDLLASTTGALASTYTADPVGNTKTRTLAGANLSLTYDYDNRTATITGPGGTTGYINDAQGNLLIRHDPNSTTIYLPGEELTRNKTTGTITGTRYYTFNGTTVAVRNLAVAPNVSYLLPDPHGTNQTAVQLLGNGFGAATRRYYDPYGNQLAPTAGGTWPDTHAYLNKPTDTTSGTSTVTAISDIGAREYDPTTGRFLTADPILDPTSPQSLNAYSYANNNPTTNTDPTGLMVDDPSSNRCDAACGHGVIANDRTTYRKDSSTADAAGSCNTPGGTRACGGEGSTEPTLGDMLPAIEASITVPPAGRHSGIAGGLDDFLLGGTLEDCGTDPGWNCAGLAGAVISLRGLKFGGTTDEPRGNWQLGGIRARGLAFEDERIEELGPADRLPPNFPVYDWALGNDAVSIKSMDLTLPGYSLHPENINYAARRAMNKMINFTGARSGDRSLRPPTGNRYLDIILPRGSFANATDEMNVAFGRAQSYADDNDIQLRWIER